MKTVLNALVLVAALAGAAQTAQAATARAGEWETVLDGGKPNLVCLHQDRTFDAATIEKMSQAPGLKCDFSNLHSSGAAASISAVCAVGGGRMSIETVITSTGPDSYVTRTRSHFEGGSMKIPDMDMTQTGRRLGDCKPGDRQSPY
jgi:hypothetical protein